MRRTDRFRLVDAVSGDELVVDAAGARAEGPASAEVLLVPADRIAMVVVELPEMSAGRMQQALRWAVEDQIAGDAERQHVVPLERIDDQRIRCLVVSREDLDRWRDGRLTVPQRITPDAACLPWRDGQVVLLPDGDAVLVRSGPTTFDRLDRDLLEVLLPEFEANLETAARRIWIGDEPPAWLEADHLERRPAPASKLAVLAPGAVGPAGHRTNLARGKYAAGQRRPGASAWRRVAVLAFVVIALALLSVRIETWLLARENARVEARIETLAGELFPGLGPLVRPRAQLERAAALARGGSADRAVALVATIDPIFSGAEGVEIESLNYAEGRLKLALTTPGMDDLEALRRQLETRGIAIDLGEVTLSGDQVSAVIMVGEGDR